MLAFAIQPAGRTGALIGPAVMQSGDRFRLLARTAEAIYLYLLHLNQRSGEVRLLLDHSPAAPDSPAVAIPARKQLQLDEYPQTEDFLFIASPVALPELEPLHSRAELDAALTAVQSRTGLAQQVARLSNDGWYRLDVMEWQSGPVESELRIEHIEEPAPRVAFDSAEQH
jgi:hypothetical protein